MRRHEAGDPPTKKQGKQMRSKQIDDVLRIARRYFADYGMDSDDVYFTHGADDVSLIYSENGIEVYFSYFYEYLDVIGLTEEERAACITTLGCRV